VAGKAMEEGVRKRVGSRAVPEPKYFRSEKARYGDMQREKASIGTECGYINSGHGKIIALAL